MNPIAALGRRARVVPAAVAGLVQRAVAAGARRSGFDDVRVKDLGGIVLESREAFGEDASEQQGGEVHGREQHGWGGLRGSPVKGFSAAASRELCSRSWTFPLYIQRGLASVQV